MGACQNKELLVVCSFNCGGEEVETIRRPEEEEEIQPLALKPAKAQLDAAAAATPSASSKLPEPGSPAAAHPSSALGAVAPAAAAAADLSSHVPQKAAATPLASATPADAEEKKEAPMVQLVDNFHLTGNFAKWATDFAPTKLRQVPSSAEGLARMRVCVKLTSQSFSFQVVTKERGWNWRLYPRDAKNLAFTHASKEGRLMPDEPDKVVVGLGNLKAGHGLNFHVIEAEGVVVTIYIEVPVRTTSKGLVLREDTAEGARVWYTLEDTGVQYVGGDGVDLNKYKWMKLG